MNSELCCILLTIMRTEFDAEWDIRDPISIGWSLRKMEETHSHEECDEARRELNMLRTRQGMIPCDPDY